MDPEHGDDAERRRGLAKGSRVAAGISVAVAVVLAVGSYLNGRSSEASYSTTTEVTLCLVAVALVLVAAVMVTRRSYLAAALCAAAYVAAVAGRAFDSRDPKAAAIWAMYLLPVVVASVLALASHPGEGPSHSA